MVVLEREPRFYGNARAVYTDDECMRIFQAARMADELAKDMLQDAIFQWVLPDGRVLNQLIQKERPLWLARQQPVLPALPRNQYGRRPGALPERQCATGQGADPIAQDDGGVSVFHVPSQGPSSAGRLRRPGSPRNPRRVRRRSAPATWLPVTVAAAWCERSSVSA